MHVHPAVGLSGDEITADGLHELSGHHASNYAREAYRARLAERASAH